MSKKIKPSDVNGTYESFIFDSVLKLVKKRRKERKDAKPKEKDK